MSAKASLTRDEYLNRLRLAVEQALTNKESSRKVATVTGVSHTTICQIRKRAREIGLGWNALSSMPMSTLYALAGGPERRKAGSKEQPDFEYITRVLSQPGVTREELHAEYKLLYPNEAMSYSSFCRKLAEHRQPERATMKQDFPPGYRMEIDFSGSRPSYMDRKGRVRNVELLCVCWPHSGFTYACALPSQDTHYSIAGVLSAFRFAGGAPRALVPDNFKAAVLVSGTEHLKIQPDFLRMAQAHGVAVLPARPRSPTNKGSVEQGVLRLQRYLLPELARKTFTSFEQLAAEVNRLVDAYNDLPLSEVLRGTRREEFESRERPVLLHLPEPAYVHRHPLGRLKVPCNHRLRLLDNFYSVPFELVGQHVEPVLVNDTIEIWHEGDLVASHARLSGKLEYALIPEHEKAAARWQRSQTREGIETWATQVGPHLEAFVRQLFTSEKVSEQALFAAQALHSACSAVQPSYLERVALQAPLRGATTVTEFKRLMRLMRDEAFLDPKRPRLLQRGLRGDPRTNA